MQLHPGTVLRAVRRGGLPSRPPSESIGAFGTYSAYESEGIGQW